jgi:S-(hydroxymethyl)glutathione dehydrogenase/alcohol dehydrogenase
MVTALLDTDGRLEVVNLVLPAPGPGQVHVDVEAAAVCGRDRDLLGSAAEPRVVGHEAVGTVGAVGEGVERVRVGDPVLVTPQWRCGTCTTCVRGEPTLCTTAAAGRDRTHGTVDGRPVTASLATGALAAATVVEASAVQQLPEGVPPLHAVLFSCALPTGIGAVRNVARAWPGETVVVLGAGAVGLGAVQGAVLAGATAAVACDPDPRRRGLATACGAGVAVAPADVGAAVDAATDGAGADHVVVATSDPLAPEVALALVRPGGTVVLVGRSGHARIDVDVVASRGIRLLGTTRGNGSLDDDVPQLLELAMDGRLVLDDLGGDDLALEDVAAVLSGPVGGSPRRLVRF